MPRSCLQKCLFKLSFFIKNENIFLIPTYWISITRSSLNRFDTFEINSVALKKGYIFSPLHNSPCCRKIFASRTLTETTSHENSREREFAGRIFYTWLAIFIHQIFRQPNAISESEMKNWKREKKMKHFKFKYQIRACGIHLSFECIRVELHVLCEIVFYLCFPLSAFFRVLIDDFVENKGGWVSSGLGEECTFFRVFTWKSHFSWIIMFFMISSQFLIDD